MPIRVIEIHHPALRIGDSEANLEENLAFYGWVWARGLPR
jgi:hypothetical protein